MSTSYYPKAISIRDRRVFYVRELTVDQGDAIPLSSRAHAPDLPRELFQPGTRQAHIIDAETGEERYLPVGEFRDLYVKDSVPNLPSAVRAILDAAPSWYEWRDRQGKQGRRG